MASRRRDGPDVRRRVVLSICKKLEIIEKFEAGASTASVCSEYGIKKTTACDIRRSKEKLRRYAEKHDIDYTQPETRMGARKRLRFSKKKKKLPPVSKPGIGGVSPRLTDKELENLQGCDDLEFGLPKDDGSTGRKPLVKGRKGVKLFRAKLNELIREHNLSLSQIYNADETGLLWRSLPRNTRPFNKQQQQQQHSASSSRKRLGPHVGKDRVSLLCCANADGTHRLKLSMVGESPAPPLKKGGELPVTYYQDKKCWFDEDVFYDWFFKHFVPEVRRYQQEVLKLDPSNVKALLLLDKSPSRPNVEQLITNDGQIKAVLLPRNCKPVVQPMDHGIILSFKRRYQKRYLKEAFVLAEEEEGDEKKRGERSLRNVKNYSLRAALSNLAASWREVGVITLANGWKKLLEDDDVDFDFKGIRARDFHQILQGAGEREVRLQDVEAWLEESDGVPGYQVLTQEEIADEVLEDNNDWAAEEVVPQPRAALSEVREWMDNLISYVDTSEDEEVKSYYAHLCSLRKVVIRKQECNSGTPTNAPLRPPLHSNGFS